MVSAAAADAQERRLALIIGNSNYEAVPGLPNAVGDSQLIAGSLISLGFEVTQLEDATLEEMQEAIETLASDADSGDVGAALLYFSGHGFQMGGENYLVPVDAVLDSRAAVAKRTVSLDRIIKQLESEDHETIILLDACRDNPLPQSVRSKEDGQGLAMVTSGSNTYIAFATRPGGVTADGRGEHGPFAAAVAEGVMLPDVPISGMMTRVRHAVFTETNRVQEPWSNDTLHEEFFFNGGDAEAGVELASADSALPSLFDMPAAVAPTPTKVVPPTSTAVTQPKPTPAVPAKPTVPAATNVPAATDVATLGTQPTATQPRPTATTPLQQTTVPASSTSQQATTPQPATAPSTNVASLGESPTTPTLKPLQSSTPSVLGVEVEDEESDASLPPEEETPSVDPVKVASLMQKELSRIGCYTGTVDGDWGKGSRTALRRYFAAKQESVPGTDPTEVLLARLTDEDGRVCEPPAPKVAKPVKPKSTPPATQAGTGKGKGKATTSSQPRVASEPAAAPPSKPKLKLGAGTGSFR